MMSLFLPSYKQGFARSAAESDNPGLWEGLVGAWAPALGPTGLTVRDWRGKGNHGTLTNMAPATDWVMTEKGWALDFTAAGSEYVAFGSTPQMQVPYSIDMYALVDSVAAFQRLIYTAGGANLSGVWLQTHNTAKIEVGYGDDTGVGANNRRSFTTTGTISASTWYHIVCNIHAAQDMEVWVDGQSMAGAYSGTGGALVNSATPGSLGRLRLGGNYYYSDCQIASCVLRNRALVANEIQQLYEDPMALFQPRARVFAAAVASGLSIPIAMRHYMQMMGAA